MISVNELMLGDYITLTESLKDGGELLIFKIIALNNYNGALVLLKGEEACDEVEIDNDWCGIPIIPAILEKNGWFFKNGYWTKKGPVRLSWHEKDATLIAGYWTVPAAIEYVHQIQAVLRLLGLEDIVI